MYIKTSGMMAALQMYRASLGGGANVAQAEAQLIQATDAYIEKAVAFGDDEATIVKKLHLESIGTPLLTKWRCITTTNRTPIFT